MHDLDASNKALWAEVKAVRAENDRLRVELAQVNGNYHACRDYLTDDFDRANAAEAAIARVRGLCARWRDLPVEPPYMTSYQSIQEFILHTLDGTE